MDHEAEPVHGSGRSSGYCASRRRILREQEAGSSTGTSAASTGSRARRSAMEEQVRRAGGVGRQAGEGARGRERQDQGSCWPGRCSTTPYSRGWRRKTVRPAARQKAVVHLRSSFKVSESRVCAALGVDRSSVRYRDHLPDDGASAPARSGGRAPTVWLGPSVRSDAA
jgi:hypothetical protein